jgi:hypothetical protein
MDPAELPAYFGKTTAGLSAHELREYDAVAYEVEMGLAEVAAA